MPYKLFTIEKKIDLKTLLGHGVDLQDVLRFSEGTSETVEDLHYENSPEQIVTAYEIIVPIDNPCEFLISPKEAQSGTPKLGAFLPVTVQINQGIVLYPRTCHYVKQAGRFMVLKAKGGWKFSRHAANAAGECIYQDSCKAREDCPRPR